MALDKRETLTGFSQSPVKRGKKSVYMEESIQPLLPNEIIRLRVNFHSEEYTTLNEPVMGQMIINNYYEAPVVREKNFGLRPGYWHEFFLNKITDRLLPLPYATNCINRNELTSQTNQNINQYLHNPLSRENCIIGCMAQRTMNLCECWPPELPFIKGSLEDSQENQMKWCDWDAINITKSDKPNNMTWFQYCFSVNEKKCTIGCRYDCR
jgi:hypothetical protein